MEKTLKDLFDLQKFLGDPKLSAMISDTEKRYDNALFDDDLENVSAAGEPCPPKKTEGKFDG